jgi:hypothetical protein
VVERERGNLMQRTACHGNIGIVSHYKHSAFGKVGIFIQIFFVLLLQILIKMPSVFRLQ